MTELDLNTSPYLAAAYENDRAHVFHSWSAQGALAPVVIAGAKGSRMWDDKGNTWLDFSSQLVNVNIGHQHPKLVAAIQAQAARLCTIAPSVANDMRSEAARLIAELAPGDLDMVFFTNGGTEAVENAVRLARGHTGRLKVLSAYRSYHGATGTSIGLTGDPRRWANEPSVPGAVEFWARTRTAAPSTAAARRRSASARSSISRTCSWSRARTPWRRSSSRPWSARTASSCRRTAIWPACAHCATSTAS
jgi:4-aminobutyrate aminotransferase-like enzyme